MPCHSALPVEPRPRLRQHANEWSGRQAALHRGTSVDVVGRCWDATGAEDVEAFKFWRMTDEANPQRVAGGTVSDNLDAVSAFYNWAAARYGVRNPVIRVVRPRCSPHAGTAVAAGLCTASSPKTLTARVSSEVRKSSR
jgi:hypothetical protein